MRRYPQYFLSIVTTTTTFSEIIQSYLLDSFFHSFLRTSLSSSTRAGSSSSWTLLSGLSGSLDSSTCSSTFSCLVRRAINCDFNPLELRERQSSSFRRSFTYKKKKKRKYGEHFSKQNLKYKIWQVQQWSYICMDVAVSTECWGLLLKLYLHWFRVKFSPVSGSTKVFRFVTILLLFLLDRKSLI